MGEKRRRWLVSGRVQGVFFRKSACDAARRIGGLEGYARNLDDGRVEVLAEGPEGRLEALEEFLRKGPIGARVTSVVEAPPPEDVRLSGFEIRW